MNAPEKKSETGRPRKAYRSPIIHFYGAIRTITEDIGNKGGPDGGTNPKTKTTV